MLSQLWVHNQVKRIRLALIWGVVVWGITWGSLGCDDDVTPTGQEESAGDEAQAGQEMIDAGVSLGGVNTSGEAGSDQMILSGVMAGEMMSSGAQAGDQMIEAGSIMAGETTGGETTGGDLTDPMDMNHSFPPAPDDYPRFSFPIHQEDRELIRADPVFGFDHDPREGNRIQCTDYAGRGFPHCYDGHEGSDFMLEGGFDAMDAGSARVVAALSGEVVSAEDGNYDRCHADLFSADVSCDGYPMRSNFVRIRHDNGWVSIYYHLKSGSVRVRRGQRVDCGEELGLVGSSGYSSSPHLHFEVIDRRSGRWDPFAGPESQTFSLWVYQPELSSEGTGVMSSTSLPSNSCSSPSR
jgi:hypothetical protein